MAPSFEAFQWHSYEVSALPPDAVELARSPVCLQAWRIGELVYGVQFHAEVTATDSRGWIVNYGDHPDAQAAGVERESFLAQTDEMIGAWNQLGRDLCGRFLDVVQLHMASPSRRPFDTTPLGGRVGA